MGDAAFEGMVNGTGKGAGEYAPPGRRQLLRLTRASRNRKRRRRMSTGNGNESGKELRSTKTTGRGGGRLRSPR